MSDEFKCASGDGTVLMVDAIKARIPLGVGQIIHVAAAQVRAVRGEAVGSSDVEVSDVRGDGVLVRQRSDWTCAAFVSRADVPRLIAELGAWLAAHPAEAAK